MKTPLFLAALLAVSAANAQPQQSNKHFWYALETSASPESVWAVWTDVPNWKTWDTGLKDASVAEALQLGTQGTITSWEGRKSKFEVVDFVAGKSYTFRTKLPLGSLYVKRILAEENGQQTLKHEVWFRGLTAGIFAKALGPKFREMLPEVVEKVRELAEGKRE